MNFCEKSRKIMFSPGIKQLLDVKESLGVAPKSGNFLRWLDNRGKWDEKGKKN